MSELGFHNSDVDFWDSSKNIPIRLNRTCLEEAEYIKIHIRIVKIQLRHQKSYMLIRKNKKATWNHCSSVLLGNSNISKWVGHRNLSIRNQ